jgi:hypothetical protein
MLVERGEGAMGEVSGLARLVGAGVGLESPRTGRLEALLTHQQLLAVAQSPLVLFIDRRGVDGVDMDIQRELSGANYIEAQGGYNGSGVRGEVMDSELRETHLFFQNPGLGGLNTTLPPIKRPTGTAGGFHGTAVYSTVFADGNPTPQARGHMPHAQGYFLHYNSINAANTRYALTEGTIANECIFQTNSWGGGLTPSYTTISAEMDTIIFDLDISILQSQSNWGSTQSRPQAWAKNIIAVGGFEHHNTLTRADDCWCGQASIGPASDGRIKPDLTNFYDFSLTASNGSNTATTEFGGTSNATPSTAGALGLMYEMWADGLFGNAVGGGSVFAERPHAATAKALAINTAYQYNWLGGGPNGDMTRFRQGWGMINVQTLYDARSNMFVVDESDVITQGQTAAYAADVAAGTGALKVTMVYRDPAGNPASALHRVNDLTLRVVAPDGVTVYWGNNGATAGLTTPPGGAADVRNTVENVFIDSPAAGEWTIEVQGNSITADAVAGTVGVIDASFALVVTGALPAGGGCEADLTTGAIPGQPGYGVPDGVLNNEDFFYYLAQFTAGNAAVADLTTGAIAGQPGYGVPNGVINNEDFFYYLALFSAGC